MRISGISISSSHLYEYKDKDKDTTPSPSKETQNFVRYVIYSETLLHMFLFNKKKLSPPLKQLTPVFVFQRQRQRPSDSSD
jgi:hypothetical protein